MKPKRRIYSIPYNGTNPAWFLQETEKRKDNIDHVYCELPYREMLSHVRFAFDGKNEENVDSVKANQNRAGYVRNCLEFLRTSYGRVRRICPVNAMYYKFGNFNELQDFVINIAKLVKQYRIDGLILSDYRVASMLHAILPELEIHTSCNGYQWNLRQMEIWREKCGVTVFNPPREILRIPSKLKEMHKAGYKLKCLINEGCLMGCPNTFIHNLSISLQCYAGIHSCCQNGLADIFRGNWILPRWQKHYDEFVDIYKIAGRNSSGDYPFKTLDAYLTENDSIPLTDLMFSGTIGFTSHVLPAEVLQKITLDKIPDKLLTCECKECARCNLCTKILSDIVPKKYWETFNFKIRVVKE